MSVILNPKSTGNRDKNSVFPMPSAIPQPVLDTSSNTTNPNIHFACKCDEYPTFMPKCGTMPESGHDVADPNT